jgi:hypothetical protein
MTNIDFLKIPEYYLIGANLKSPRDITSFFIFKKIKYYCYDIDCIDTYSGVMNRIKTGMSADLKSDPGERLYRQIAHLDSWGDQTIKGSSGDDFLEAITLFQNYYGYNIDHKNCIITIHDMTDYPFQGFNPEIEIKSAEEILIVEHEKKFNMRPLGNQQKLYVNMNRSIVYKSHFESLYDL